MSDTDWIFCMGCSAFLPNAGLNKPEPPRLFKFFARPAATFLNMIRINENYTKLKASYLFSDIAKRVNAYVTANPSKPVIRLGIGDVTEPLPPVCLEALHAATDEMGNRTTFKGYGPEQNYAFLREAVAQHDY